MGRLAAVLLVSTSQVTSGLRRSSNKMRSDDAGVVPANDTTARGCNCVKVCGASLANHHRCDWCNVDKSSCDSRWSLTRGDYDFCTYKDDDDFVSLSAGRKTDLLWGKIIANSRSGPLLSKVGTLKEILTVSMISTFDNVRESMPEGRKKVIHGNGVMLQFDFQVQGNSPYSGMLAPGTHRGLMRLGSAMPPESATFPGIGIKFLRSGIHSANTVALRQNGDDSEQIHFFEEPLTTHVAPPAFLEALGKFNQASGCRAMTGISDFCSYSQSGQRVSSLHFPYELQFEAPNPMQFAVNASAADKNAELLNKLASIPSGTHLYWVNAKATPSSRFVRVGKIVTSSVATTSLFGDAQLSFRHQRMEEDFAHHPEWVSQVDKPHCEESVDRSGKLRPLSDWQCPGVVGVPPL